MIKYFKTTLFLLLTVCFTNTTPIRLPYSDPDEPLLEQALQAAEGMLREYRLEPNHTDDDFFTNTILQEAIEIVQQTALDLYKKQAIENDKLDSRMRASWDSMSDEEKCLQKAIEEKLERKKEAKSGDLFLGRILSMSHTEFPLTPQDLAIFEHMLGDRFPGIALTVHRADSFPEGSEGKLLITHYSLSPEVKDGQMKGIRFDYTVSLSLA